MPARIVFPFQSSFYYFSLRVGTTMVVTGDGLLSLVRLLLLLTRVQIIDQEHKFAKMDIYESRLRYSILFGTNTLACILLGAGIITSERRPWPVLMIPWLVMFLCCTWLYYPNIIYHYKKPLPVICCVLIMGLCLYCWCVVLSFFLEVLERSSRKPLTSDITVPTGLDTDKA